MQSGINTITKMLIIVGLIIVAVGILFSVLDKLPSFSFRLPGDILIKRKDFIFYFPLGLCIILSIIMTILFRIFR
jgi:hypothetical protein